jgi:phospholipid/cholesterol/gamma-HCH transport system permease protein
VLPRILATMIMLPVLTMITCVTGVLGGLGITLLTTDISARIYLDSVWLQTKPYDIYVALIKVLVFGFLLSSFSCVIGLRTEGGAKEVGESTTRAVVWSFMMMAIVDFMLSYLFYSGGKY